MSLSSRALTVLVIAHNGVDSLPPTIERVYRALTVTVEDFRIIIFDDGSTDGTHEVAKALSRKYPFIAVRRNESRLGPGFCTIEGSSTADTPFVVYIPGDNTWPLRSYIELFGHIGKADVITSYSHNLSSAMSPAKRFISRAYTWILNLFFRRHIRYYNGLTIYPTEYLRQGPIGTYGFGFQAEALMKAVAAGYSFLEIALPVDAESLLRARTVTPRNVLNASATILRLFVELHLLHRARFLRPKLSSPVASGPGVEEMGIGEVAVAPSPRVSGPPRGSLRIVITGASSGIGESLARALDADGHRLFLCARRGDRLARIVNGVDRHRYFPCDVAKEDQVAALAASLTREVDGLDVLINCAGSFGEIGPVAITDSRRWLQTVEVNLFGTYLMNRHLLPLLAKGKMPRIINLAGGGSFSPFPNYSAYACSKTAIVRLTECLAEELLDQGIRVNAIAPGFVPTEMHQMTLAAGEARAGKLQYQRTLAILEQGGASMENFITCVRGMIAPAMDGLTGKTISSNFDPWQTKAFEDALPEITRSDLYTLRRINVVNLPEGRLRQALSQSWAKEVPER
jgi:NAD(P)-dependent dehydrogenase (short-subunit alcohol dehydrogenase family)